MTHVLKIKLKTRRYIVASQSNEGGIRKTMNLSLRSHAYGIYRRGARSVFPSYGLEDPMYRVHSQ